MPSICIVIPAYNEEKRIGPTLEAYSEFFEGIEKKKLLKHEILVAINNTTDRTLEIVQKHMRKHKNVSYIDLPKGGKGYAVIEGFRKALATTSADFIGFTDADSATSADEYYKLISGINGCDAVIGERYSKEASISPKPTKARYIAKRMFNFVVRAIMRLPYKDTQCGAKIFRRKVLERIIPKLSMSQWAFDVELLYHANRSWFRVCSVPTKWVDKKNATINFWSAGPLMVLGIIRLRLINSPLKGFVKFYDSFTRLLRRG